MSTSTQKLTPPPTATIRYQPHCDTQGRGRWWLLMNAAKGWESFGFAYESWADLEATWDLTGRSELKTVA